ncbi:MAG TPA: TIGR03118 family protein [Caldimonas sp.]
MNAVRFSCLAVAVGAAIAFATSPSAAVQVSVTNLVTDDAGVHPAQIADPGLVNAWGLSYSATSPFWVSSNGVGTAVLYRVNPATQATTKVGLTVHIPGAGSVTGQVFNGGNGAGAFGGDLFLFVSEDGTMSGWRGALGTTAETLVLGSADNVYKGAAFSTITGNSYLYAANFRAATIDVLKGGAGAPALTGTFTDPNLPAGYAPFNIQNLGGTLYVTYAQQDATKHDEIAGAGFGFVDSYDLQGNLLARVANGGTLDAPWGLTLAPSSFGALAGALLVGNFGDGRINAYDPTTDAFLGQVDDAGGNPLSIDGLWALAPGNDGGAGSSALLYFTAGPNEEGHGLFGVLSPVPEPSTGLLTLAGLVGVGALMRRRTLGDASSRVRPA